MTARARARAHLAMISPLPWRIDDGWEVICGSEPDIGIVPRHRHDVELIAAAPGLLAELCDELDRAEAELAEALSSRDAAIRSMGDHAQAHGKFAAIADSLKAENQRLRKLTNEVVDHPAMQATLATSEIAEVVRAALTQKEQGK